jgi:hypothetical protein
MMKLRSQSSDFRSKQSASKGRSSFSPGSTSPKEEEDEEEEEEEEEEDVNEEEEEEEEDVNEDEDQDEVVVPPKKKQAYKASTPLSSSSSSAPLRRRCVTVKVHGIISTSTSVPSKAAQPKSDNIQDNNPQEQGNAIGTMSSSTSSAKVDRPQNSHLPDEIQLFDGQVAKFESEIDLQYSKKKVTSTIKGNNLNLSLYNRKDSYNPFRGESVRPVISNGKLQFSRFASRDHEIAGLKNIDQCFSGTIGIFRLMGKNEQIVDANGISFFSFASGLLVEDDGSPFGLRMEPGALNTPLVIKPMIESLSAEGNFLGLTVNMGTLRVFEHHVASSLENLRVTSKGKTDYETLTCVKPLRTTTSSLPTTTAGVSASSATPCSSDVVVSNSSPMSSSSSISLPAIGAGAFSSLSGGSSSSFQSPKSNSRQRHSKLVTPFQSAPLDTIQPVSSTVANSVGTLQGEDGNCCNDDDLVLVSISVQTLRLLGAHLVSLACSDGEPNVIFLTNNTQHVILYGLHTSSSDHERIDLSQVLNADS